MINDPDQRSVDPAAQRDARGPRAGGRARVPAQGGPAPGARRGGLHRLLPAGRGEGAARPARRPEVRPRGGADRHRARAGLPARPARLCAGQGDPRGPRRARHLDRLDVQGHRHRPRRRARRGWAARSSATSGEESRTRVTHRETCRSRSPRGSRSETDGGDVRVKGPKGELAEPDPGGLTVAVADGEVRIARANDEPQAAGVPRPAPQPRGQLRRGRDEGLHPGSRDRGRRLQGRGQGQAVVFTLGYSHPVDFAIPEGISDRPRREGRQADASPAPTGRRSARRPPRSASSACPIPTRPRESSTPTKSSAARSARRAGSRR